MELIIIAAVAAAALLGWMAVEAGRVRIRKEDIQLAELPSSFDGTRLFFISDLHRRKLPDGFAGAVAALGGADLVVLGGDIREKGVPLERTRGNIRILSRIAPVYAVYGNHDYNAGIRELDVLLEEEGVHVLVIDSVLLEQRDGAVLRLAGVDDAKLGRPDPARALAPDPERPAAEACCTILVSHDPAIAARAGALDQVGLMLAGHTHGGQIVLPLVGPLVQSPSVRMFRRGWFSLPAAQTAGNAVPRLFVSCGFGTSRMPLRLGAPAESHLFILRAPARDARSSTDR